MAWVGVIVLLLCLDGWLINAVEYRLNGVSYIVFSLIPKPVERPASRSPSMVHLLFRTAEPSGILVHGRATNGDFFTLELVRGKLRFSAVFDRGSSRPGYEDIVVGDDLGDDQWHQIDLERRKNTVLITLDITKKYLTSRKLRRTLNINMHVSLGGFQLRSSESPSDPSLPKPSLTNLTFKGCFEDVTYDRVNILQATQEKSKKVHVIGSLQSPCDKDADFFPPVTLTKSSSFIQLNITGEKKLNLRFKFRTFDHSGILVHHSFGFRGDGHLLLQLVQGKLWISHSSKASDFQVNISPETPSLADGLWHTIQLNVTRSNIAVQLNNQTVQRVPTLSRTVGFPFHNALLKIGSTVSRKSTVIGCIKEIYLNGKENINIDSSMTNYVEIEKCYLIDLCFTNPCLNSGRCTQHNNTVDCDCKGTGYQGSRCENQSHLNLNAMATVMISHVFHTTSFRMKPSRIEPTKSTTPFTKFTGTSSIQILQSPSTAESTRLMAKSFPLSSDFFRHQDPTLVYMSQNIKQSSPSKPDTVSVSKTVNPEPIIGFAKPKTITPTSALTDNRATSVRITMPPTEQTSRNNHGTIIIIEKHNKFTRIGFDKNQLLIYLFLCLVFILCVGLIVIISVKLSRSTFCKCFNGFRLSNRASSSSQDSMELNQHDSKENVGDIREQKMRSSRRHSLNDSGIDRRDSGMASDRSSGEVSGERMEQKRDSEIQIACKVSEKLDGDSIKGFLILQEDVDPLLYTQNSFGWSVFKDSESNHNSKTSRSDLFSGNEDELGTAKGAENTENFRPKEFAVPLEEDSDLEGSPKEKSRFAVTGYRPLQTDKSPSLESVYIDLKQRGNKLLKDAKYL